MVNGNNGSNLGTNETLLIVVVGKKSIMICSGMYLWIMTNDG